MDSGFLLVDKPSGMTSFDVIRILRKQFGIRKMGHAGTLDKFAEGLLLVAIGKATKALFWLQKEKKTYEFTCKLGSVSDTIDPEGNIVHYSNKEEIHSITQKNIHDILPEFVGEIEQVPPKYSAVKISGKRASDRVRNGEDIIIKQRKVTVYDLKLLHFENPFATFEVDCSSGFYVRSLVRDMGERLSVGAYCTKLVRKSIGNFQLEEACVLEDVSQEKIRPIAPGLFSFPSIKISLENAKRLRFGQKISVHENSIKAVISEQLNLTEDDFIALFCNEVIVCVAQIQNECIIPIRVF